MDAIEEAFSEPKRKSEEMTAFGFRLKNQFSLNESYRRPKELEWLESLRQYKGLYDPDVQITPGNSRVYPKITRSKVNIVLSRLHEMLFPETDKNWELDATPEPNVSKPIVMKIIMGLIQQDEQGNPIPPTPEDVHIAIKKFAEETVEKMESVMDDQFTEMDYPEETKKVLRSGLMYGTGIMKGPLINNRTSRKWEPSEIGEFEETTSVEDIPFFEAKRIWDWYPDMATTEVDKIEGSFERHIMTKHDLRKLLKRSDFYADLIEKYMEENPSGNYVPKNWEVDLQVIEMEAAYAGKTATTIPSGGSTNRPTGKKYEVLEYWGYVDGSDLEACGVKVDDVTIEYGANVWLLGNVPIKAVLFDGALDQYKVFYYEKDETSIFGEGLARVMRHSQLAISAGARMVLDNGACVTGDTVVYRNHHSTDRPSEITVRELWEVKKKHNSGLRRMKLRSVNESTGEIFYNRIVDVYNNGVRPVFEVKTSHGYCIKATDNHRFISDDGEWKELSQFCIGDNIAVNGRKTPLEKVCVECGAPLKKDGALRCKSCASKKENNPWNMKQAIDANNSTEASQSTARQRWACQKDKKTECEKCGARADAGVRLCIHHVDENPYNNEPSNKVTCCQPCHMAIHHRHDYFGQPKQHVYVDYDEIISIEYVGDEEVFDIEVEAPNHNFIANGFVVHNCVAGPQVEVNIDLVEPDSDITSFHPRKVWLRSGRGPEAQYPAIRGIEFESHIPELLSIIDAFKQFGDEETTLPTWMIGQMVNNETAQATSGRMATITISIKDVVKNFDTFTEKIVRDLYAWNMEFNPRPDIKGDFKCKARGVSSLVMKEIRMQALNQLSTTMTPEDWVYVDRREFLKEKFKAHDINVALKTEEEADKIRQAQENSLQMQLAVEMQKAEIAYKKSQTMAQLTKAKEHNVSAQIAAQTPIEANPADDPRLVEADLAQKETDRGATEAQIRRDEENHMMEMAHAGESHNVKVVVDTTKAASEIANKGKMTEAAIKMKEETAKAKTKQAKSTQQGKPVKKAQ
jgi:hypothetical protein